MVKVPTDHPRKILLEADSVTDAILKLLLGNLPENIIDEASRRDILIHLRVKRKRYFGKDFSKSDHIEIISPVPRSVESRNVTRISGKVGHQSSPAVGLDLEKKSGILKRFQSRKLKKDE